MSISPSYYSRLANTKKQAYFISRGPRSLKKRCCGDWLMFNLGAPIEIPCYFIPKSVGLHFGQLQHPNWTLVGLHNITFLNPNKYILERKSILLVKVLKLDFRVLCQPTISQAAKRIKNLQWVLNPMISFGIYLKITCDVNDNLCYLHKSGLHFSYSHQYHPSIQNMYCFIGHINLHPKSPNITLFGKWLFDYIFFSETVRFHFFSILFHQQGMNNMYDMCYSFW